MANIEFFNAVIKDLENKKSLFVLCDGYDGWNYGYPINPICLNYEEYRAFVNYLQNKFHFDLENCIIQHSGWDCILPDYLIDDIGKRVATVTRFPSLIVIENEIPTEEDWKRFLFKTKEEKQKTVKEKEELFQKLSFSNVAIDKIVYCGVSKRRKVRLQIDRWNKNKYRKQVRTKLQKHCIRLRRVRAEDAHRLRERHVHRVQLRPRPQVARQHQDPKQAGAELPEHIV